ncbi:MAG: hypothetical protein ACK59Y_08535 [Betaproteobacteria bacterium]|jgi:hypothetical protein
MRRGLAVAALLLLAACEGLLGGEELIRVPLQATAGGYAPVRLQLKPEMNPVAINLHADFAWGKSEEAGQWNAYRAELRRDGQVIASREVQVNSPEKPNVSASAPPSSLQQPLLHVDVPAEGEYEVLITATRPVAVTLNSPELVVRIKVPRAQQ